jgi:hypothetical protein
MPSLLRAAILVGLVLASVASASAGQIAIRGYDTVAYFTQHAPVRGTPAYTADWVGSTWQFASAANRDLFLADPVRYLPQFGGLCTGALGYGVAVAADPEAWRIVDGRLYLFADKQGLELDFDANPQAAIDAASAHWPQVSTDLATGQTMVIGQ